MNNQEEHNSEINLFIIISALFVSLFVVVYLLSVISIKPVVVETGIVYEKNSGTEIVVTDEPPLCSLVGKAIICLANPTPEYIKSIYFEFILVNCSQGKCVYSTIRVSETDYAFYDVGDFYPAAKGIVE